MRVNEFISVSEMSAMQGMTSRNVRKIISRIKPDKTDDQMYKDTIGNWWIHESQKDNFIRKHAKPEPVYYAITLDVPVLMNEGGIRTAMAFALDQLNDPDAEINYVIERKLANNLPHIHGYYKCNSTAKMKKALRTAFSSPNYYHTKVFDLDGWVSYITKDGSPIIELKK